MDDKKQEISNILNKLLASSNVLYVKVRNYHWNVEGPHFQDYHKFFESTYDKLAEQIDEIAERIRILENRPFSSMKEFLEYSLVQENHHPLSAHQMLLDLSKEYNVLIEYLNKHIPITENFNDLGTADFLTGMLQDFEKKVWMLTAMSK